MTSPDPANMHIGRAIANPANHPAASTTGPTFPSADLPAGSGEPRTVPGLSIGFAAVPTRSTVVKLPFMELPLVGFVLAIISGLLSAFTFAAGLFFATVQAANLLLIAFGVAAWNWDSVAWPLMSLALFAVGAFVGGALMSKSEESDRHRRTPTLVALGLTVLVLAILVIAGVAGSWDSGLAVVGLALSAVAGAMGTVFQQRHNMLFGAMAITSMVQLGFNFLARGAFKARKLGGVANAAWARIFLGVVGGFLLGSLAGAAILFWVGSGASSGLGVSPLGGGLVLLIVAALFFTLAAFSKRNGPDAVPLEG